MSDGLGLTYRLPISCEVPPSTASLELQGIGNGFISFRNIVPHFHNLGRLKSRENKIMRNVFNVRPGRSLGKLALLLKNRP
jgi:hypothetical protein